MNRFAISVALFIIQAILCRESIGQQLTLNSSQIEELIEKWNTLHNDRNHAALENIYDDEILFYAERTSRSKATLLKKLLFVRNPGYKQRISSNIKYTLHTNGIVKCEFRKDMWKNSEWESDEMYLLIGYKRHGYWIIGESDYKTDKQLGFTPKIGEVAEVQLLSTKFVDLPELSAKSNLNHSLEFDDNRPSANTRVIILILVISGGVSVLLLRTNLPFQKKKTPYAGKPVPPSAAPSDAVKRNPEAPKPLMTKGPSPREGNQLIELKQIVPTEYLSKLFNPSIFKKKKRRHRPFSEYMPDAIYVTDFPQPSPVATSGTRLPKEAFHLIEHDLKQRVFKDYVLRLFDPYFFKLKKPAEDQATEVLGQMITLDYKLQFEFNRSKSETSTLNVQYLYAEDTGNDSHIFAADHTQAIDVNDSNTYVVIGLGGPPDRPDQLYLIPSKELKPETCTKKDLKPYAKAGMFFYNAKAERLQ